jgi:signal transduction histidine kinase
MSAGVPDLEAKLRQDAPAIADDALELALACEQAQASALAIWHGLTPPILRDGDLLMALRALASRIPAAAGTRVTVVSDIGLRLPLESCRDVYRIVQEALNNALKHANSRTVDIALRDVPDGVEIVVADDGACLSRGAANGSGLGMRPMQHRTTVAGGKLRIESSQGGGTRVLCTLPRMRPAGRAAPVSTRSDPGQDFDPTAVAVGP